MQAFGKHIGRRQYEGRAVHEHGHAAGQQLGGDLVHLLGRAEDGEQHPPAEEHLQIRAVHDAHRVQALQLFPQAVHDARVGHPVDVRQNDAGGRLLADDEFLERQRLIADDAPDGRDVFLVVLGKSRTRAAERHVAVRLLNVAPAVLVGRAEDDLEHSLSLQRDKRVPKEQALAQLGEVGLRFDGRRLHHALEVVHAVGRQQRQNNALGDIAAVG